MLLVRDFDYNRSFFDPRPQIALNLLLKKVRSKASGFGATIALGKGLFLAQHVAKAVTDTANVCTKSRLVTIA
jgi:hypothetical protein